MTAVHTPNYNTSPLPQISMPKVLCRSLNLNPLLDSLCQMTNTNSNSIIIAPHGDDNMMDGPQLCIVPVALVSGDSDGVNTSGVRFQSTELFNFLFRRLSAFFLGSESNDQLNSINEILPHRDFREQRKTML